MLAVAGCATVKDETASAVDLYYGAYHIYENTCYHATPGNEMRWCWALLTAMDEFRVSIDNMRVPLELGGDASIQRADLKQKGIRVLYLVKNESRLRAPDPPRVTRRPGSPAKDLRQASFRRNHPGGDPVAAAP